MSKHEPEDDDIWRHRENDEEVWVVAVHENAPPLEDVIEAVAKVGGFGGVVAQSRSGFMRDYEYVGVFEG